MKAIRFLFFTYLALWIFEGSLRKWILPQFSDPLLISRDPIVLLIYIYAFQQQIFPKRDALNILYAIASVALLLSLTFGISTLSITLFGLRTDFLHVPLVFLIPKISRLDDLTKIAKWFSILSWPMALLMVSQFVAPSDSWLNKGAGGGDNGQIEASLGHIRPAGFFSYNTGAGQFLTLTAALLFGGWINKSYSVKFIFPTMFAILMAVLCSGSRTTVISVGIVTTIFIVTLMRGKNFWRGAVALIFLVATLALAMRFGAASEGVLTLSSRFEGGGGVKDGLLDRILNGFTSAWSGAGLTGVGLGVGTNAGAKLLTGELIFLVSEGEWARVIGESGFLVGTAFIIWRIWLVLHLLRQSILAFFQSKPLAILIFAAAAGSVMEGQWGQPTTLGFAVIAAGFCLAACESGIAVTSFPSQSPKVGSRLPLGRSKYAQLLHGQ